MTHAKIIFEAATIDGIHGLYRVKFTLLISFLQNRVHPVLPKIEIW